MAWQFRKMARQGEGSGRTLTGKTPAAKTPAVKKKKHTPFSIENMGAMPRSSGRRIKFPGKGKRAVTLARKRLHGNW